MALTEGIHPCAVHCRTDTRWEFIKGKKRLRCVECKTLFPCRKLECGHYDCEDERNDLNSQIRSIFG